MVFDAALNFGRDFDKVGVCTFRVCFPETCDPLKYLTFDTRKKNNFVDAIIYHSRYYIFKL